jgi:aspartyl-tRNA(Asn)/glutamyl-tRNA(Gln) amidotransferase subunit A
MTDTADADLGFTPATTLAAEIAARRLSPVEVTEASLRRTATFEPLVNAMDQGLVACIRSAEGMTACDYLALLARKHAYCESIHRWFDDWDILLTPSASVAAFPVERLMPEDWPQHEWDWLRWAQFSYPFNIAQNPSISVPAGFTASGLPVGLQITGRRLDDTGVLRAATAFEAAAPWRQHRPAMALA